MAVGASEPVKAAPAASPTPAAPAAPAPALAAEPTVLAPPSVSSPAAPAAPAKPAFSVKALSSAEAMQRMLVLGDIAGASVVDRSGKLFIKVTIDGTEKEIDVTEIKQEEVDLLVKAGLKLTQQAIDLIQKGAIVSGTDDNVISLEDVKKYLETLEYFATTRHLDEDPEKALQMAADIYGKTTSFTMEDKAVHKATVGQLRDETFKTFLSLAAEKQTIDAFLALIKPSDIKAAIKEYITFKYFNKNDGLFLGSTQLKPDQVTVLLDILAALPHTARLSGLSADVRKTYFGITTLPKPYDGDITLEANMKWFKGEEVKKEEEAKKPAKADKPDEPANPEKTEADTLRKVAEDEEKTVSERITAYEKMQQKKMAKKTDLKALLSLYEKDKAPTEKQLAIQIALYGMDADSGVASEITKSLIKLKTKGAPITEFAEAIKALTRPEFFTEALKALSADTSFWMTVSEKNKPKEITEFQKQFGWKTEKPGKKETLKSPTFEEFMAAVFASVPDKPAGTARPSRDPSAGARPAAAPVEKAPTGGITGQITAFMAKRMPTADKLTELTAYGQVFQALVTACRRADGRGSANIDALTAKINALGPTDPRKTYLLGLMTQ